MEESFHFSGNFPDDIEILKSFVNEGVMLVAVSFNILADILSGPFALAVTLNLQWYASRSRNQIINGNAFYSTPGARSTAPPIGP